MSVNELPISEFCKTGSGGTPSRSKSEYYNGGTIPWVKSGELHTPLITDTEEHITEAGLAGSSAKMVPAGAILLAMYGATVGKVAQLGVAATTNQAVCNIVPDEGICDKRYLIRCLESKCDEFISKSVGGGQPNISQQIIKATKIRLPPLPEQRRIAAILDKADELRQKRRQAIEKLDELLQSVFLDMFGDPVTNPKGWEEKTVGELEEFITSGSRGWAKYYSDDGDLFIRIQNLKKGVLDLSDTAFVQAPDSAEAKRTRVKAGDILVSITADLGRTAVVPEGIQKAHINQHLAILRLRGVEPAFANRKGVG